MPHRVLTLRNDFVTFSDTFALTTRKFFQTMVSNKNHYEKNPSSYGGISHMQYISGVGSQDSG
jgi:hypothetical protein